MRACIPLLALMAGCSAAPSQKIEVAVPAAPEPPKDETIYCDFYVERRGVEQCPEPLAAEAATHMYRVAVFHKKDGRLQVLEILNGSGSPADNGDRVAHEEYEYEGDHVSRVSAYSSGGTLRYREIRSADQTRIDYVSASGRPKLMWELATAEERQFDEKGFVRSRRFFDRLGHPTKGEAGAHELRIAREEHGYWTELSYFDDSGKPVKNKNGCHKRVQERGAHGTLASERCFGTSGEPLVARGTHGFTMKSDVWGNTIEARYFDAEGKPARSPLYGARWTYKHDARGNITDRAIFGLDDKPATQKEGWSMMRVKYDERGRETEKVFLQPDGSYVESAPIQRLKYDDRDRVIEMRFPDPEDRPAKAIVASQKMSYDSRDNLVHVQFLGPDRRPVVAPSMRAAEYIVSYNADDQPIEKKYFDADGNPTDSHPGSAVLKLSYDEAGKVLKKEYFDPAGNPTTRFGARHLLVMYQGSMRAPQDVTRTKDEARARAEEARKKILEGLPFEDAVGLYSDEPGAVGRGGDLGVFPRGRMVRPFEDGLFATPIGEISAVVETPFGFHVIERTQ